MQSRKNTEINFSNHIILLIITISKKAVQNISAQLFHSILNSESILLYQSETTALSGKSSTSDIIRTIL